jgi:hypothetical protein
MYKVLCQCTARLRLSLLLERGLVQGDIEEANKWVGWGCIPDKGNHSLIKDSWGGRPYGIRHKAYQRDHLRGCVQNSLQNELHPSPEELLLLDEGFGIYHFLVFLHKWQYDFVFLPMGRMEQLEFFQKD